MIVGRILISLLGLGLCFSNGYEKEVRKNPGLVAGTYYVYEYNHAPALKAAPAGFQPFYISHYARHGARYGTREYDSVYSWLAKAAGNNLLSEWGKEFFSRYENFYGDAKDCKGNLTNIGKEQHRSIASHMFKRFPEVFKGETMLDAKATEAPRVIMSMWSCISELQSLDPDLNINADASAIFAPWLQPSLASNKYLVNNAFKIGEKAENDASEYFNETVPVKNILAKFFVSEDVPQKNLGITAEMFISTLYTIVAGAKCLDEHRDVFEDVFTEEDMFKIWKALNVRFFMDYAHYSGSECLAADYAAFTLKHIIESADADITSGNKGLRLRFGHDSGIAPLLAFMNVNGFGRKAESIKEIQGIFPNYNIPMGASLLMVFYRNQNGVILVRIMLNEAEATLPFNAVNGSFYSWEDFKAYYLPLIEVSETKIRDKAMVVEGRI